jgi:hypothetical protein
MMILNGGISMVNEASAERAKRETEEMRMEDTYGEDMDEPGSVFRALCGSFARRRTY